MIALLGLVVSLGWNILVLAVGGAFLQALSKVRVEPWVLAVLSGSVLLLIVTWLIPWYIRLASRPQAQARNAQTPGPQP